jgi:hypothetical protein
MSNEIANLRNLINYIDGLQLKYDSAKKHILDHIKDFKLDELNCMWLDGILTKEEIAKGLEK